MTLLKNNCHPGGGRINYLDALKCIGILLVIEGHVWYYGMGIKTYDTISGLMLYTFNMPIFFFVSGFLAYKEEMNIKQIVTKLWQKFLLLIVPAIVFKVFLDLQKGHNPVNFILQGFGEYWFTITLFECFLLYYIVAMLVRQKSIQMIVMAILALAGVGILCLYGKLGPAILDINRLAKYLQFFVFGIFAMRFNSNYVKTMQNEWLKAIAIIAFFVLLFTINNPIWPQSLFHLMRDLVMRYLGTFIVISLFVCKASFFDKDTKANRLITQIGKKSLAIYLLQYFFMPRFLAFPEWVGGLDDFTVHVISVGFTIVITLVCLMFISLLSNSRIVGKYVLGIK